MYNLLFFSPSAQIHQSSRVNGIGNLEICLSFSFHLLFLNSVLRIIKVLPVALVSVDCNICLFVCCIQFSSRLQSANEI
jgi:hypothetical protein